MDQSLSIFVAGYYVAKDFYMLPHFHLPFDQQIFDWKYWSNFFLFVGSKQKLINFSQFIIVKKYVFMIGTIIIFAINFLIPVNILWLCDFPFGPTSLLGD